VAKHRADCTHCARIRAVVQDFRAAREAAELRREATTAGYSTENRDTRNKVLDFVSAEMNRTEENFEGGDAPTFEDYLADIARYFNRIVNGED